MRKGRLTVRAKDIPLQPNAEEEQNRLKKEAEQLNILLGDDDFTVDQLFQTLDRSKQPQKLFGKLHEQKIRQFLAKNHRYFLQTQQQLGQIKLPPISEIIPMQHNQIQDLSQPVKKEELQENSVFELLDSFNNSIFEGNSEESLRLLRILREMQQTDKYEKYFHKMDIAKMSRENYWAWVESCHDPKVLLQPKTKAEVIPSVRLLFSMKTDAIINQLSADLNVVQFEHNAIVKALSKLLKLIEEVLAQFKSQYKKFEADVPTLYAYPSKWLETVTGEFYQLISPHLYGSEELSEGLVLLGRLLSGAAELEVRGISVVRILQKLIARDLSTHIEQFIDVIMDSFGELLTDDRDEVYEMARFDSISSVAEEMAALREVDESDYKVVVSSKKAILLINAYGLLMEPVYDRRWQFLHPKLLSTIYEKSKQLILNQPLSLWDYYNFYRFFDQLHRGEIRGKRYNNITQQYKGLVRTELAQLYSLSRKCWDKFEAIVTQTFFRGVLAMVPKMLWDNGKIYASKQKVTPHPQAFVLETTDLWKEFAKQLAYRLREQEYEFVNLFFWEYFLYMVEYVVYISYHSTSDKPENFFLLSKKNEKMWQTARNFPMKEVPDVQEGKLYKLSYFSTFGMQCFVFDMHFLAHILCTVLRTEKISAQLFVSRLVKVQEKQKKNPPVQHRKQTYLPLIQKCQAELQKKLQAVRPSTKLKRANTKTLHIK